MIDLTKMKTAYGLDIEGNIVTLPFNSMQCVPYKNPFIKVASLSVFKSNVIRLDMLRKKDHYEEDDLLILKHKFSMPGEHEEPFAIVLPTVEQGLVLLRVECRDNKNLYMLNMDRPAAQFLTPTKKDLKPNSIKKDTVVLATKLAEARSTYETQTINLLKNFKKAHGESILMNLLTDSMSEIYKHGYLNEDELTDIALNDL